MQSCPQCGSRRIVTGTLIGESEAVFKPDAMRFLTITLFAPGAELARQSLACRDCGLVWTFADKDKLNKFLRKHCKGFDDDPA